ncbi:MAG: RNA-binding protein [Deltaproteobacteria bacterium]|nr:RNA-binding protein [Deltaproteobacteria bacterium]
MMKTIYVGNVPFSVTEEDLNDLFAQYGTVHQVKMISDRDTGRYRGFSFIDMDDTEAEAAISALDGTDFNGRTLRVNEARERTPRPPRQDRW